MKNISYKKQHKISAWRKTSLASWKPTGDSSCYGFEDVIVDDVLIYCKANNISIYSFFIKTIANVLHLEPKINSTIRWGKLYERETKSVFFHTISKNEPDDLTGIVIRDGHSKSIADVQSEFKFKIKKANQGINDFVESKKIVKLLPAFFTKSILNIYSFFAYSLNINLPLFKQPNDAFGSVMLTSVGQFGIANALCPIAPYTRVPMVISMGDVIEKPVVIDQKVQVRKVLTLGFTFDHRIMDGVHIAKFINGLRSIFNNPNSINNEQ